METVHKEVECENGVVLKRQFCSAIKSVVLKRTGYRIFLLWNCYWWRVAGAADAGRLWLRQILHFDHRDLGVGWLLCYRGHCYTESATQVWPVLYGNASSSNCIFLNVGVPIGYDNYSQIWYSNNLIRKRKAKNKNITKIPIVTFFFLPVTFTLSLLLQKKTTKLCQPITNHFNIFLSQNEYQFHSDQASARH